MTTSSFTQADWYDLPRYYDIVFDEDTRKEADFLEAVLRAHGSPRGRRVLEPACGSGRLVEQLARRGYAVTGFDRNPRMLAYARSRLPGRVARRVRLFQATLDDFRAGFRFDLAYCLVSTFKYLPDERSARLHLRRVASALAPGAVYVLGFHLSEYGWTSKSRERWVGEREGVRVVCNTQFWPPDRKRRRERVRARLTVEERGNTSRYETAWWFRTYDAGEVTRLIRAVPELEHVATYDFDYRIDRPRKLDGGRLDVVVVLRRRSRGPVGRAD